MSEPSPRRAAEELIPTRASLLARLKNWDDSRSWMDFFNTYWRLIYGRAVNARLSDQEAQEVVQETVISIAKKIHEFKVDPALGSFKTWLYLIVSRRIADQHRKRDRANAVLDVLPEGEDGASLLENLPGPAAMQPDAAWDAEWENNLVAAAMERVKEQVKTSHYQIFDYHVIQSHSVTETAKDLQTNAAMVHLVKHRVGRLVRKEVEALREELM